MPIVETIRERIQKNGPLSFRDFMEMALYEPGKGYYVAGKSHIGFDGDYFTSPNLSSLFGAMIARQVLEMWEYMGVEKFTLLEIGAGTGKLCNDILNYISGNSNLINNFKYCIVEKNETVSNLLQQKFPGKIAEYRSVNKIPPFRGCILTNEVVDNFPVHRVVMQDELMEVFVGYKQGFMEFLVPAREELKSYLEAWNIILPKGYYTEINLDAKKWIKQLSAKLESGYVITIDYGYSAQELYHQKRNRGSMMCFKNHKINDMPYYNIGNQDITTHVNFSALSKWGMEFGLENCGMVNQSDFLLRLGIKEYFISMFSESENVVEMARMESRLTQLLLIEMGSRFRVLIQKKGNVPGDLSGIKH